MKGSGVRADEVYEKARHGEPWSEGDRTEEKRKQVRGVPEEWPTKVWREGCDAGEGFYILFIKSVLGSCRLQPRVLMLDVLHCALHQQVCHDFLQEFTPCPDVMLMCDD